MFFGHTGIDSVIPVKIKLLLAVISLCMQVSHHDQQSTILYVGNNKYHRPS